MQFKEKPSSELIVQVEPSCNMPSVGTGREWPRLGDPGTGDDECSVCEGGGGNGLSLLIRTAIISSRGMVVANLYGGDAGTFHTFHLIIQTTLWDALWGLCIITVPSF